MIFVKVNLLISIEGLYICMCTGIQSSLSPVDFFVEKEASVSKLLYTAQERLSKSGIMIGMNAKLRRTGAIGHIECSYNNAERFMDC